MGSAGISQGHLKSRLVTNQAGYPFVFGDLATTGLMASSLEKEQLQTNCQAAGSTSKCQVAYKDPLCLCLQMQQGGVG